MLKKILGNKKLLADAILVSSLLLVALSVLFFLNLTREQGAVARVSIDGKTVAEYPLSINGKYTLNGGTNVLVIEEGKAYLVYSECPDKTCVFGNGVHGNKISYNGERIVCLPNKVMIEIVGGGEEIIGG